MNRSDSLFSQVIRARWRWSHIPLAVAGFIGVMGPSAASADNRIWRAPVQVSHVDTTGASLAVAFSRSGSARLHAILQLQAPPDQTPPPEPGEQVCSGSSTLVDYLTAERSSLDWAAAWSGRQRFTWDNTSAATGALFSTDTHMTVDALDRPQFAYEEHQAASVSKIVGHHWLGSVAATVRTERAGGPDGGRERDEPKPPRRRTGDQHGV